MGLFGVPFFDFQKFSVISIYITNGGMMSTTTGKFVLAMLLIGCIHQAHILKKNIGEDVADRNRERVLKEVVGIYDEAQNLEKPYVFEQTTKETI